MDKGCKLFVVAALIGAAAFARADDWPTPFDHTYYSDNEAYYLRVVPGDGGKHASAALYEVVVDAEVGGDALIKWSRDLENPIAPVKVLVADSGKYVVTFDDWGRLAYGPNVVVIYGPDGEVIKNYALDDLLPEGKMAAVGEAVRSDWWRAQSSIDEKTDILKISVALGQEFCESPEPGVTIEESIIISIRLRDGEVLP